MEKVLIGGRALIEYGSSRGTNDTDYMVSVPGSEMFIKSEDGDLINAAGSKFFAEVWEMRDGEIATPSMLVELKAYALVQHCLNGFWQKADDAEYDIKFLVRKLGATPIKVKKYISAGEWSEIEKIVKSVK